MEPSVGSKGGVGVVIHPSIENMGETNQYFIQRIETTNQNSKINHDGKKTLTQILFQQRQSRKTPLTETGTESGKTHNTEVIEIF
jgi:hypothetical protein